ncbi:MAG: transcriptional regulator GcvA [Halieaceae bacterium]|jgi:LysR family transcriptional regulator, glycine cleavage system transcriptional activator|nr:transcriptional regulator GcvA [Halieaceae bacterium]
MRNKLPPLNALRSFEAAARHSSFKEAADELCVSHSAISHQIKLLETNLGLELFTRKARAVELTRSGKLYYPVLREAFDNILEATQKITAPHAADIITVQVYSTFAIRWLIPRLPNFQLQHPDIQLRLNTAQAEVDFSHSDVDACIKIGLPDEPGLSYRHLFSAEVYPVCSPSLLTQGRGISKLQDIENHTILQVYPSPKDWDMWLRANNLEHIDPNAGLQFDSYDHALATAVQGLGVAMGMQAYLSRELASGTLVELFKDSRISHYDDWYFVCRAGKEKTRKITLFGDWLCAQILADEESFSQAAAD